MTTNFGLTPDGFRAKRLEDIKADIEQRLKDTFGTIDVSPESVTGQLIGIFSKLHADLWEQAENIYNAQHPSEAEGVNLDYIGEFNGLTRLEAISTKVKVGCNGLLGTTLSLGTQVRSTLNNLFQILAESTLTNNSVLLMYIRIDSVEINEDYTITIDTTDYVFNSGPTPTLETIANGLVNLINTDLAAVVVATRIIDGDIKIETKQNTFDIVVDSKMLYFVPIDFESIDKAAIASVANTLTTIETPVSGLDEVDNFEAGITGRDEEEDAEFRIRRANSLKIAGGGNLEAIVARMLDDVEGVTMVKGFENREDFPDGDGRPAHSIHIVVVGGANQDIGDMLWKVKGGGIQTHGEQNVNVIDSNGDIQVMHFSRPVNVNMYIEATLTLYDEEIFPVDGVAQVQNQILTYGSTFQIGLDVMPDRFKGYIFLVPGIAAITVKCKKNIGDPWQTTPLTIGDGEIAVFDLSRITVLIP